MAKKRRGKVKPQPTKHQLSRWERQKRTQRIIFASGILVIVAVFGMVGFGWYTTSYQPMHETVLSVNTVKFDMGYFLQVLRLYTGNQQGLSLNSTTADQAATLIEHSEETKQAAAKVGVTVSDAEVKAEIDKQKLPSNQAYKDVIRTQLLYTKLQDNYFSKDIPATTPQRQVMAMFLESKSQAADISTQLANGGDFGTLAGSSSLDSTTKTKSGDLGWQMKGILNQTLGTTVAEDAVFATKVGAASSDPVYDADKTKSVGYLLVKILEKSDTQVHPASMLLGSMEEAQNVKAQLTAGGDFATLAKQYSQEATSAAQGGDLGWLDNAKVPPVFSTFATGATAGALSDPIKDTGSTTKGGYWLFKVTAEDTNKDLSADQLTSLKNTALTKWLQTVQDSKDYTVTNNLDSTKKTWALTYIATHP